MLLQGLNEYSSIVLFQYTIYIPYLCFALLFAIVVEVRGLRMQITLIGILFVVAANLANFWTPSCNADSKFKFEPQPTDFCPSSTLPNVLIGIGYSVYSVVGLS